MTRMTTTRLEDAAAAVNRRLGIDPNGPYSTIGKVRIGAAYGGYRVERVTNEHGGIEVLSAHGYGTMREAWSFLRGMQAALDLRPAGQ